MTSASSERIARRSLVLGAASVLVVGAAAFGHSAVWAKGSMTLTFGGVDFEHRWSNGGQNEFTPKGQENLNSWHDMITFNVQEAVTNGEQLAALANGVLGTYQRAGTIVRTTSRPLTAERQAEHLVVAVLGNAALLEAVFARFVLIDGVGTIAIYSHRVYGQSAGPAMSEWLQANGPQIESALMAWDKLPKPAALKALPQSN